MRLPPLANSDILSPCLQEKEFSATAFLPWADACGYSAVFFTLGGAMVLFFLVTALFLPETKGKTLEEIEKLFQKGDVHDDSE